MEEKQKKTKTQKAENAKVSTKKATVKTVVEKEAKKAMPKKESTKTTVTKAKNEKAETATKEKTTKKQSNTSKRKEEPKLTIIHEKKETQKETAAPKNKPKQAKNIEQGKKPKQEKKQETKNNEKQPKEDKPKTGKKNYIDISVGAIIGIVVIIGLIILNVKLGTLAYSIITEDNTANSGINGDTDINVTEEVGNVLNNSDELVTKIKEKITFAPNVTASIYNEGTFNTNSISNDLKLILGWTTTEEGKKLKSKNENNKEIEVIEKETMAENIKNVLGPNVKYKDETFSNTNISTFSQYVQNEGTINYSNGMYTSILIEDTENAENKIIPIIYQEIQRVVKYSTKVIVYVKVAYMDVKGENYIVYRDFSDDELKSELLKVTREEVFGENDFNKNTGEGTVTEKLNSSLDDIRSKLNTYKYTFSLDQETGEYYLSKFNKALSIE